MGTDALGKLNVGTAATWHAAGLSRAQLAWLAETGELVRVRYGVYATARILARAQGDPGLAHALQVAAARAARTHKGVASHHSAALMHGLDLLRKPADGTVTLTVPPGTRNGPSGRAGVVHHAAELPAGHVIKLYDVPVTTAARTVTDIARTASFMDGVVVADSALRERHVSKTELRRVLAHCQRWPGASRAGQVIDFADGLAESVLESCARVFFRDQGLPPPELQVNIVGREHRVIARVDFLWRSFGTIAEADGLLKYDGRADAIAELKRDRLLREAGFEVVHFTWKELFTEPKRVAARIREAFNRAIRLAR
jgi:predicted transcriptional regulator of viral defense system